MVSESFNNTAQHDAHELFNRLLNSFHIELLERKEEKRNQEITLQQTAVVKKQRMSIFCRKKQKEQITKSKPSDVAASQQVKKVPFFYDYLFFSRKM